MTSIQLNEIKETANKHNVSVHIVSKAVNFHLARNKPFDRALSIVDQHISYDKNRLAENSYKNRINR